MAKPFRRLIDALPPEDREEIRRRTQELLAKMPDLVTMPSGEPRTDCREMPDDAGDEA
jgi:hypothetical protein